MQLTELRVNTILTCIMLCVLAGFLIYRGEYAIAGTLTGTIGMVARTLAEGGNGHSKKDEEGEKK